LASHYRNLEQKPDEVADSRIVSEQHNYVKALSERIEKCEAARRRLESIGREIARDLPEAQA